jgi:hypothetical protein
MRRLASSENPPPEAEDCKPFHRHLSLQTGINLYYSGKAIHVHAEIHINKSLRGERAR